MLAPSSQSRTSAALHLLDISADFVVVATVGALGVVRDCLGTFELVKAGREGDDIALTGDVSCESGRQYRPLAPIPKRSPFDWASHLINL